MPNTTIFTVAGERDADRPDAGPNRRSRMRGLLRNLGALVALFAMIVGLSMTSSASAATMQAPKDSQLWYTFNGERYNIGVIAVAPNGRNAYCIETGSPASYEYGEIIPIGDSAAARQIAYLTDRYQSNTDPLTQAAIGMLIHEHFEALDKALWAQRKAAFLSEHPSAQAKADALWNEAQTHTATAASATYSYIEGKRSGYVDVSVTGSNGAIVSDVPYTVTLTGPAAFDNGSTTASGKTAGTTIRLQWKATGTGSVTANVSYDHGTLERLTSGQDYLRYGTSASVKKDAVSFNVVKDFQPRLSTAVSHKVVDAGDPVDDAVTSSVADGDTWKQGLTVTADGYYFSGIASGSLTKAITPTAGEGAKDFLARLKVAGYEPDAYGTVRFDGAGQTTTVRAVTTPGGSEPYTSDGRPGFGTWVWTIDKARQEDSVREWLRADYSSGLLEQAETLSVRAPVAVDSTATEHSATVGSEISDQITVSGFPDDHGEFAGDEGFGFGPDRDRATVSVYWAGDTDNAGNDRQYKPSGAEVPAEDAHHKLVGTWEYPARNGLIKVGAGAPDADGDPVTITAQTHGYYIFVYSFEGDDRVKPAVSAYDDAWERVFVEATGSPHAPSLTTAVIPPTVAVGKEFRDSAKISGTVKEGSYVTFTAYEPVDADVEPGTGKPLLDEARVELDASKLTQTVLSPAITANKPGKVYWKATLWSPDGEVLDSHPLGIDGEVTTIEERPEEPTPDKPAEQQTPKSEGTKEPETPRTALPVTGVGIGVIMIIGIAALATGGLTLAMIRRRS